MVYTTTQTHSLGAKAALVLGLTCRAIPVKDEDDYGLRGAELRRAIEEDVLKGRRPFILSKHLQPPIRSQPDVEMDGGSRYGGYNIVGCCGSPG